MDQSGNSSSVVPMPLPPEARLRAALRRLEAAQREQAKAVAAFRSSVAELKQTVSGLKASLGGFTATLDGVQEDLGRARTAAEEAARHADQLMDTSDRSAAEGSRLGLAVGPSRE